MGGVDRAIRSAHVLNAAAIDPELDVDLRRGIGSTKAANRLGRCGPNDLAGPRQRGWPAMMLHHVPMAREALQVCWLPPADWGVIRSSALMSFRFVHAYRIAADRP